MAPTDFRTGSPCWIDLGTPDIDAAAAFYGSVLGWSAVSAGPDTGGYVFLQQGGRTVAAAGPLQEPGAATAWTVFFLTPDAEATAKAAEQAGGTVRVPPMDVMDAGRLVQLTDPTGGRFAAWEAGTTRGLDEVGETGALCWTELHSADLPAALGFYRALFGWRSADSGLPGVEYTILSTADGDDQQAAGFGGAAGPHPGLGAGWLVHFAVADTDAAVAATTAGGGTVVLPAETIPTVGRLAVLADPFGAQFAVITPDPRQS
ncbi:VOC family protein [Kitasatospora paranensis]|uniref:VOC family protein n=1 Tax=Kitasatospora paranensis TaxID=258053 RepID=A0ABW2G020_9ACTN